MRIPHWHSAELNVLTFGCHYAIDSMRMYSHNLPRAFQTQLPHYGSLSCPQISLTCLPRLVCHCNPLLSAWPGMFSDSYASSSLQSPHLMTWKRPQCF